MGAATTLSRMELVAGALLERPPGPRYLTELRFAELAPKAPLPKPSTLARWRGNRPEGFELGLRVPETCWNPSGSPLRAGEALERGLAWIHEACDALDPSVVVLATGAAITTGARDRERLREYLGHFPRAVGRAIVWRPTGLWEPEAVQRVAASLSVVGGFDAVDDPAPRSEVVYGTLLAEGFRRSFPEALLADVVDKLRDSGAARAFVTIDSPQSFREARLLQALFEGHM